MKKTDISIVYKSINDLIPYVNNARMHSDQQINQIASSIKEFGFTNPVLIDGENGIIAGHGRVLASKKLNIDIVPTIELSHLTEAQKKAYIIADNKLALNAGWDDELLKIELEELKSNDVDFDFNDIGFSADEINKLFDSSKHINYVDDIKEKNIESVTVKFDPKLKNFVIDKLNECISDLPGVYLELENE